MKERFKMFRRKGGMFYARDTATMGKESLGTKDRVQASRLVAAKNQAQEQPALNKGMAKVHLAAASPEFASRIVVVGLSECLPVHSRVQTTLRDNFLGRCKAKASNRQAEFLLGLNSVRLFHRHAGPTESNMSRSGVGFRGLLK